SVVARLSHHSLLRHALDERPPAAALVALPMRLEIGVAAVELPDDVVGREEAQPTGDGVDARLGLDPPFLGGVERVLGLGLPSSGLAVRAGDVSAERRAPDAARVLAARAYVVLAAIEEAHSW